MEGVSVYLFCPIGHESHFWLLHDLGHLGVVMESAPLVCLPSTRDRSDVGGVESTLHVSHDDLVVTLTGQ